MEDIKYPIGKYQSKKEATPRDVAKWIDEINEFPDRLHKTVNNLNDDQLNTVYRKDGWTIRQVIHHLADSHMNGYIRTKLALTENRPTIKTYEQEFWAEILDSNMAIVASLNLIEALHKRWVYLLKSLDENHLNREFVHPEKGTMTVKSMIGMYAWHGKHHLAHIVNLKEEKNWNS